jgi:hypothetical protein
MLQHFAVSRLALLTSTYDSLGIMAYGFIGLGLNASEWFGWSGSECEGTSMIGLNGVLVWDS